MIAKAIGRAQPAAHRILNGTRPLKAHELAPLEALLAEHDHAGEVESDRYVPVEIFPTFAGAGGGGTGDGPREVALLPRDLIEGTLHGKPRDFLVVEMLGTSMLPLFHNRDQLIVDLRHRDPRRMGGGPFFLRISDAHLIKNVALTREGLRVFSANTEFGDEQFALDELAILGRVVWFGRTV